MSQLEITLKFRLCPSGMSPVCRWVKQSSFAPHHPCKKKNRIKMWQLLKGKMERSLANTQRKYEDQFGSSYFCSVLPSSSPLLSLWYSIHDYMFVFFLRHAGDGKGRLIYIVMNRSHATSVVSKKFEHNFKFGTFDMAQSLFGPRYG